ncbi:TlpA disulfide reductase family protein [Pedobacter rhodius]|uniref:TlpA disulfide reductase family protein n=1 Tax=Pedobacter rhodius TaxID=3004098 RepID=A0ABT4KUF7_9SPHI|nr:TlpA disulfide reductase family protein [Pedobacter sp. SJ11]MCZ4222552.1 TlpA disulfide reductase family protein [Pedobacter sp. SJ11]
MASMFLLMSLHILAQTKTFTLKGKLTNVKDGSKIWFYAYHPALQKDSAIITNGTFEFKGNLTGPIQAQLFLPHGPKFKVMLPLTGAYDFLNLYLDEGVIKVNGTDSVKNMLVSGSIINAEDQKLSKTLNVLENKILTIRSEFKQAPVEQQKDPAFMSASDNKIIKLWKEIEAAKLKFAKENPDSYVSLNAVFELTRGRTMNYHVLDTAYQSLSDRYKNTVLAKNTKQMILTGINTTVGSQAVDFSQPDVNGKIYKLSDFKGKYVMLEFWASWCGPCRAESPNLVKAYEKYKDKNFTIMAISLDKKRDEWLNAVKEDKIPYLQLGDLKGPQVSEVAISYGIQSIPESYIIDPNGKIIAKNLRGEALNKKLTELFN